MQCQQWLFLALMRYINDVLPRNMLTAFIRILSSGYQPGLSISHYPAMGSLRLQLFLKAIRLLAIRLQAFNVATYQSGCRNSSSSVGT